MPTRQERPAHILRIAIIKNLVAPATTPLFEALAARDDCEILVIYESLMESNRGWTPMLSCDYASVVLNSRTLSPGRLAPETRVHLPRHPLAAICRFDADVVVASGGVWSSPANVCALLRRRAHDWAFVPWWGEFPDPGRSVARRLLRPWKRRFVQAGDAWLAYSDRARSDAASLGAAPARVVLAPNAPARIHRTTPRCRPTSGPRTLLYVGQLIPRKGLITLLEAIRSLPGVELGIIGEGPMRPLVEARAEKDPTVRYHGYLEGPALEAAYSDADVVILPSLYEVWGLVVNEALAHGLPVIASDQVAAADHLIERGVTGEVFAAADAAGLRAAICRVATWTVEDYERCASVGRAAAKDWSHERAADAVLHACALAVEHRGTRRPVSHLSAITRTR